MTNDELTQLEANALAEMNPSSYQPYTLQDLMQKRPTFDAVDIAGLRKSYNEQVPPGRQLRQGRSEYVLSGLQDIFNRALDNRNARDTKKYFPSDTNIGPAPMKGRIGGYVAYDKPKDAYLNEDDLLQAFTMGATKYPLNTLLHEVSHSDHMQNGKRPTGYYGRSASLDIGNFKSELRNLPKAQQEKYFSSGNAFDDDMELRANLRASLGEQPYGTSASAHFGPLLDALLSSKERWPSYLPSTNAGPVDIKDKDTLLKVLEMNLFPRERWMESREPTRREKIKDFFDPLLKRFK